MPSFQPSQPFGRDFDRFVAFLTNGAQPALIAPERLVEAVGIEMKTLAAKTRMHLDTIKRSPNAENIQFVLFESVRVLHTAAQRFDSIDKACAWFGGAKIAPLGGAAPLELVAQGRTEQLIDYLFELELPT